MVEKRFCPYCGKPLEDGCNCEIEAVRALEQAERDFYDSYYSDPLVCAGMAQQDVIDMYKQER